ncbi:hypothetical protein R9X47_21955 [Wukongibacter baidiensis]|uniref:hypothetical protein n=1 Tax=Wukongibacter baidiensis TaxID=1723361 RepID=UPI003D7F663C
MKKKITTAMIIIFIMIIGAVVSQATGSIIDYRRQRPNDILKPNAGMRIIIDHKDGSHDDILETASSAYPEGHAKVGDTIDIRDISDISNNGTRLLKWDFQYVTPSGREVVREMSASQYGQIDSLTLDEAGTYEFYLMVMDDAKTEDPNFKDWWKNWSDNGIHRAKKELENGNEYWCYFVSISIEVEELPSPPPSDETLTINYYEVGTTKDLKSSKTKSVTMGTNEIDFPDEISFEGDDYEFVNWVFNSESSKTDNPASIDVDSSSNILNIYYKKSTPPPEEGDAYLDFRLADEIEKRGGIVLGGTYDSGFNIVQEYIEDYEDDPPYYGIEEWEVELEIENSIIRTFRYVVNNFESESMTPQEKILRDLDEAITDWADGKPVGEYELDVDMFIYGEGEFAHDREESVLKIESDDGNTGGSGEAQLIIAYTDKKTGEPLWIYLADNDVGQHSELDHVDYDVKLLNSGPPIRRLYAEKGGTLPVKKHYLSEKIKVEGEFGIETTWKHLVVRTENETLIDKRPGVGEFVFKTPMNDGDFIVYEVPLPSYGVAGAYAYTEDGEYLGFLEYLGESHRNNRIDAPTYTNNVVDRMYKTIEEDGKNYYISDKKPKILKVVEDTSPFGKHSHGGGSNTWIYEEDTEYSTSRVKYSTWEIDIDLTRDYPIFYVEVYYAEEEKELPEDGDKGTINIICKDESDTTIQTSKMRDQDLDKDITVDAPTVSGYELDTSKSNTSQIVRLSDSEKEKTVTFYYKKTGTTPPDPPGPNGGNGTIVFNPNSSFDISGNREGWVNQNITVNVSISGDKTAERSDTASRAYEYEEEVVIGQDGDGNDITETQTKSDSAPCTFTETWEVGTISVTGSATGTVSGMNGGDVTITTEGDNLQLSGTLNEWISKQKVWGSDSAPNGGSWTDNGTPSGSTTPPDLYTGTSGIYKLDKTIPESSSSISSRDWTNIPYSVNITVTDNLSGFWNMTSYYNITDRSHYNRFQANQYFTKGSKNETKTFNVNQNGVYSIHVGLEDIAKNIMSTITYGEFKFDNIKPDVAIFDINGFTDVVQRNIPNVGNGYQYMADYNNRIGVTIGDELSGVIESRFLITKTTSFPSVSSMKNLNEGTAEAIAGPLTNRFEVNLNCGSTKESVAATEFDDLKEGLWYVHIYQRDRAGNVTMTTSPPIFINKIKNLRATGVADYNWKKYFLDEDNNPTDLAKTGIPISDMPVYKTKEEKAIKLGYKVYFQIDTIGFDEDDDTLEIKPQFWAIDENNKIKEVHLYVEDDNSGDYKKIENSGYRPLAYYITLDSSYRKQKESTALNEKWHIWEFDYYLPPWTKAVPVGEELDLINENYEKQNLLIIFEITGNKTYGAKFFYTYMDDTWGKINENTSFNGVEKERTEYGRKRSTYLDLLYLNDVNRKNHGEVFWYNLYESAIDDLKLYREW